MASSISITWRFPTGETARLTNDRQYDVYPSFTPDGAHILYVRLNESWTDHEVIRMDMRWAATPPLSCNDTNFFDYHYGRTFGAPLVSPDGATFLFRSQRSGWINIWAAPTDGGCALADRRRGRGSERRGVVPGRHVRSPTSRTTTGRSICGWSRRRAGQPRVIVAPEMGVCAAPSWSPDGTRLSYLYRHPDNAERCLDGRCRGRDAGGN